MTSLTLGTRVTIIIIRSTVALEVGGAQADTSTAVQARRACARVNHCVYQINAYYYYCYFSDFNAEI